MLAARFDVKIKERQKFSTNNPFSPKPRTYKLRQSALERKSKERDLQLGFSVDGRYSTIAKTTNIPEFPAGYVTDNESLKLLLDRTVLQKEVYVDIRETNDSDPVTSNKLQDLAYGVDKNLWQLRIHLQKPGGRGEDLPYSERDATATNRKPNENTRRTAFDF